MGTYQVNVNVTTPGREKLDSLRDVIARTSQQASISTRDFQTWSNAMAQSTSAGYSFNQALQIVQTTLKKASIDVGAFTSALRDNVREQNKALQEAEQGAARYQRVAAGVGGRILGNISGVPGGGFIGSGIAQSLGLSGGAAFALGAGAAGVLGTYELIKQVTEVAKYAQEQKNLATEMGTTVQTTQLLGRVSEVTGVNINSITSSFERLSRTVADGGQESRKAQRALEELGLSSAEAFKAPETQLQDVLSALRKIPDEGERSRLVINLLGDSGKQLLPLVDNFDRVSAAVRESGVLIDSHMIDKLDQLKESTELLALRWQHVKNEIAGAVVAVQDFFNDQKNVPRMVPGTVPINPVMVDAGGKTGSGIQTGIDLQNDIQLRGRQSISQTIRRTGMSPVERMREELKDLEDEYKESTEKFNTGRGGDGDSLRKAAAAIRSKEQQITSAQEYERQSKELTRLSGEQLDPEQSLNMLKSLGTRDFGMVKGTPAFTQLRTRLSQQGMSAIFDEADIKAGAGRDSTLRSPQQIEEMFKEMLNTSTLDEKIARTLRINTRGTAAGLGTAEAYTGQSNALSEGSISALKYILPPDAYSRLQLGRTVSNIGQSYGFKAEAAGDDADFYRTAAQSNPLSSHAEDYLEQARDKELEQTTLLVEGQTKQIEAINKFNESIDEAGNKLRGEIASGLTSIVLGAQNGRGARGSLSALQSFGNKQESTILDNIFKITLENMGIGKPGSGPNPNSGMGRILQGTIFGGVGQKTEVVDNTNALKDLTNVIRGKSSSYQSVGTGGGGASNLPISSIGMNHGLDAVMSGISVAGSGAQVVANIAGGASAVIGSAGTFLSKISSVLGGPSVATKVGLPSILNGSAGVSTEQAIGIGVGLAAAGTGAYQGISTITHGGAKSILGGTSELLGSAAGVAAMFGPAGAPVALGLGIASALSGFAGSFLKDPRAVRQQAITDELAQNQYLAPTALNVTQTTSGNYASFDARGALRTTGLSAVPSVAEPFVWQQTHGLFGGPPTYYDVPGRVNSPFTPVPGSGTGRAPVGNNTGPTFIFNGPIQAIDSKSLHETLVKNHEAVGAAVTAHAYSGDKPMHSAIKFMTGGVQ